MLGTIFRKTIERWKESPGFRITFYICGSIALAVTGNLITPLIKSLPEQGFWVGVFLMSVPLVLFISGYEYFLLHKRKEIRTLETELAAAKAVKPAIDIEQLIDRIPTKHAFDAQGLAEELKKVIQPEHNEGERIAQLTKRIDDVLEQVAAPVTEPEDHPFNWWRNLAVVKNSEAYSGEWFGLHTSTARNGKTAFSRHRYTLKVEGTSIEGEMYDELADKHYELRGVFAGDGMLWLFDDKHDPRNFGMEVHFSPLTPKQLGGILVALDYHTGKAFVSPIQLQRTSFPNKDDFIREMTAFKERVRIDWNPHTIAKKIDS